MVAEANSRALEGPLAVTEGAPDVRAAISDCLEREYSRQLAQNQNQMLGGNRGAVALQMDTTALGLIQGQNGRK